MNGTLVEKTLIAKGTGLFRFSVDEDVDFTPGQYFHIKFRDDLKHHFTIINSPNEKRIISLATRMRDSEFKTTLNALPIGGHAEIYKIKGEFVLPDEMNKPIVFIALGIGITPYMSMLTYLKESGMPPMGITLIYSDSDKASMAFISDLTKYETETKGFKMILTVTSDPAWEGEKARVDEEFIRKNIPETAAHLFYISGPPQAVESVSVSLARLEVPKELIKTENFTGY